MTKGSAVQDRIYYRIQDAARACGVSASTLRNWERAGRISEPQRNAAGQRLYSDEEVQILRSVFLPTRAQVA